MSRDNLISWGYADNEEQKGSSDGGITRNRMDENL